MPGVRVDFLMAEGWMQLGGIITATGLKQSGKKYTINQGVW